MLLMNIFCSPKQVLCGRVVTEVVLNKLPESFNTTTIYTK